MPLKKVSKRNSGKKLSKKQSGGSRPRRKATKKNPPTLHNDEGYCLLYNNCKKQPFIHTNVNLYWGPSTLKGAGNGVFAGKAFKKGEIERLHRQLRILMIIGVMEIKLQIIQRHLMKIVQA